MAERDECPICYNTYTDPRTLPCGHSFCQRCITRMTQGGHIRCPTDRTEYPVPPGGFSINYALQNMLEQRRLPNAVPLPPPGPYPPLDLQRPPTPVNIYVIENDAPRIDLQRPPTPVNIHVIENDAPRERTEEDCPRKFRKGLYETLQNLMDDDQQQCRAAKLSSECRMETNVAVYLFVKSWPGFVFWFMISWLVYKKKIRRAFKNWFFEIYFAINTLFAFIWLIVGCSWTFGRHADIREECPLIYSGYSDDFINFAIFLTSVDLFVCFVVMMLLLSIGCFDSNDCI